MEPTTAYCKHCKCNTPVVNSIPPKWWSKHMFWIILGVICLPLIGLILVAIAVFPGDNLYCEKCGSFIGHKSEVKNRCVYCDAILEPGATFCPNCGKKFKALKNSVICKKCKTENTVDSKFCSGCGAKLPVTSTHK